MTKTVTKRVSYKVQSRSLVPVPQTSQPPQSTPPQAPILPDNIGKISARGIKDRISHLCDLHNYDPVKELLQCIDDSKGALRKEFMEQIDLLPESRCKVLLTELVKRIPNPDTREIIGIHKELLGYIAPKLKSVDMQGNIDVNFTVVVRKFS